MQKTELRTTTRSHAMPFGAQLVPGGTATLFRFWAPAARRVEVCFGGKSVPMDAAGDGWHQVLAAEARAGTRYRYRIDGGPLVPDPASRFQPEDAEGPSEVIDPLAFAWEADGWLGRPWEEAVIYELHLGTFTPEGSYAGAASRLEHLRALGVTAVELMPLADFVGRRNWGYDGVLPFAPDSCYGRPEELKALVQAAHRAGLMIFLDVVYNHFGPKGNYLPLYAPQFFTDRHQTPWGAAINYDGEQSATVREFFVQNALYWLNEYGFDGLRFDAVHAIVDDSPRHVLEEIAQRARAAAAPGRHVHLVLENDANQARFLGEARYVAQWNDDAHHALHVLATGESDGYYADYADAPARHLARCLAEGFAYQGEPSTHRGGEPRGEPSAALPASAFVDFLQNHDQIGNRAFGDRIAALASEPALRALTAIYLLAPSPPLLFMGEEWGAKQPFLFFCDFEGDLARAVREGRRGEFKRFAAFQDAEARERIPDPLAEETFRQSVLRWTDCQSEPGRAWLAHYRELLALRRREIVPRIAKLPPGSGRYRMYGASAFEVNWDEQVFLVANCSDHPAQIARSDRKTLWRNNDDPGAPWAVTWSLA